MRIVEHGMLGYTELLDTTLELLSSLKTVIGFVLEEMLPGYRTEALRQGKEGKEV